METLINSTSLGNIIIVTGSVLLLFVLIKKFAWEQLAGVFEAREEKIASDIDGAEVARQKAENLLEIREKELGDARTEATEIVDSAKETGKLQELKIIEEAKAEATRLKEKAKADIDQSKTEAIAGVKDEVSGLTVLLAEKLMTQNLDEAAQNDLINNYLDKLGES